MKLRDYKNLDKKNSENSDENLMHQKMQLREHFKTVATAAYADSSLANKIGDQIVEILPRNITVAAFIARADEPSLQNILLQVGINLKVAFPKLVGSELEFFVCESTSDFIKNKLGIFEPNPNSSQRIEISDLFAVIAPGLAFDRKGMRLGRGKGFYDRALASFSGLKIGVCASAQIVNTELPHDDFDVAMDIVVSEKFILKRFDS